MEKTGCPVYCGDSHDGECDEHIALCCSSTGRCRHWRGSFRGGDTAAGDDKTEEKKDEDKQQVTDDGKVIMSGAVGKPDRSKWITKKTIS